MPHTPDELLLIEMRGEAPLVKTRKEFDGFPLGALGYIAGVDGPFIQVRLAGSDGVTLLRAHEVENV
jgi:hypothetical protein